MSRTVPTASDFVRIEIDASVATIRIDRPKMNPLSIEVQDALGEAARLVSADDEVAAVVLYGGDKVFAAGADKRAAAEAGSRRAVTEREADDLVRDADRFLALVETALGLTEHVPIRVA